MLVLWTALRQRAERFGIVALDYCPRPNARVQLCGWLWQQRRQISSPKAVVAITASLQLLIIALKAQLPLRVAVSQAEISRSIPSRHSGKAEVYDVAKTLR